MLLNYLVIYGLNTNLVVNNGSGVLVFQREKMYTSFRYISTLFLILGVFLSGTISYFLYRFIYSKFNMYYISETINVVLVAGYNVLVSYLLKKRRSFNNYLYDNSFSFAYDIVFTISVLFLLNYDLSIVHFFVSLIAAIIVIFVVSVLMGFFVRSLNSGYVNISARNIAVRLFMFAIFSVIVFYAQKLV